MSNLLTGILVTLLGLLGLFLASRALDGAMHSFGLLLFLFAVLFDFYLIHKASGDQQQMVSHGQRD